MDLTPDDRLIASKLAMRDNSRPTSRAPSCDDAPRSGRVEWRVTVPEAVGGNDPAPRARIRPGPGPRRRGTPDSAFAPTSVPSSCDVLAVSGGAVGA
jgi:hypothetical protein